MKNSTKNYQKHLKIEKMLVPGPGDRGSDPILLFLTPKSDSVGRNTMYNSPQIPSYDYFTCLAIVSMRVRDGNMPRPERNYQSEALFI